MIHSKAALKITSGPELPSTAKVNRTINSKKFAGDILLRFIHATRLKLPHRKHRERNPSVSTVTRNEQGENRTMTEHPDQEPSLNTCRNAEDQ